ncbi:MAG TPA: hypothetical protein VJP86_04285 [Vicinamibacterales bacterium]|nr:hypothetical protein [Vicinamibacterales bacterium]
MASRWGGTRRIVAAIATFVVVAYVVAFAGRIYARKYYIFLPDYVSWAATPAPTPTGPVHLFVLFADHFEPNEVETLKGGGQLGKEAEAAAAMRVRSWGERYADLASRHRDSNGRPPRHTWFYPGEQEAPAVLSEFEPLVRHGLGEVELHFHHEGDTEATLAPKLAAAIKSFQKHGFLITRDGRTHFAFVHGNFALDSGNPQYCGLTEEIRLLRNLGCFADFTFPSVFLESQPPFVNSIYAAKDDGEPKSYKRRFALSTLVDGTSDLMMFQGPLVFAPTTSLRRLLLALDDGDVHPGMPAEKGRIDRWIRANVHVPERPDWVFIKLFAHGISSPAEEEAVLGSDFDNLLTAFEKNYNDGNRYVLHYVTAREAYNLAISAASGAKGAPEHYFDTPIPPYLASMQDN